jgi:hypothetical protein
MAVYRIRVVPYSKPDHPGEWIRVDCNPIEGKSFHEARRSIMQDIHAPLIGNEVCTIVEIEGLVETLKDEQPSATIVITIRADEPFPTDKDHPIYGPWITI